MPIWPKVSINRCFSYPDSVPIWLSFSLAERKDFVSWYPIFWMRSDSFLMFFAREARKLIQFFQIGRNFSQFLSHLFQHKGLQIPWFFARAQQRESFLWQTKLQMRTEKFSIYFFAEKFEKRGFFCVYRKLPWVSNLSFWHLVPQFFFNFQQTQQEKSNLRYCILVSLTKFFRVFLFK